MDAYGIAMGVLVVIVALFAGIGVALKGFNARKKKPDVSQDTAGNGQDADGGGDAGGNLGPG